MSEKPTIEAYQQNIEERNFQAYKCVGCGCIIAPPSGTCYGCGGTKMEWAKVSGKGNLVSFTVTHIAPYEFQEETPYYVAISTKTRGSETRYPIEAGL